MKHLLKVMAFLYAVLVPSLIYAETLTLSTYYPAPFGAYSQLRLVEQDDSTPFTCNASQEGVFYYSSVSNQIKICNGTTWTTLSPWSQNGAYTWLTDSELTSNPYPSWKVGIGINNPLAKLHLKQDGGIIAEGTFGSASAAAPISGAGTRFTWHPGTASLRAGVVTGTQWNTANLGNYSVAFGLDTQARTSNSTVAGGALNVIAPDGGGSFGTYGFIGSGYGNTITAAANSSIVGGTYNSIPSTGAGDQFIGGGAYNSTGAAMGAIVVGGRKNTASGIYSFVGGGGPDVADVRGNQATADKASVVGGMENTAGGPYSFVGGGVRNSAGGSAASIPGGDTNSADGDYSFIGGGQNNTVNGNHAAVIGGEGNTANGNGSATIAGGTTDSGGYDEPNLVSGINSVIVGGQNNQITGDNSFIAAGRGFGPANGNSVSGTGSAIIAGAMLSGVSGSGSALIASNRSQLVGGGSTMLSSEMSTLSGTTSVLGAVFASFINAGSQYSAVIAGNGHQLTGTNSAVLGGNSNTVTADNSAVLAGTSNVVTGNTSVAMTGFGNNVESTSSFAGGNSMHLTATANNSFAWGDGAFTPIDLAEPNTFYVFPGGNAGYMVIGSTANADAFNGGPYTLYVGGKMGGRFDGANEGELKVQYSNAVAGQEGYYAVLAP